MLLLVAHSFDIMASTFNFLLRSCLQVLHQAPPPRTSASSVRAALSMTITSPSLRSANGPPSNLQRRAAAGEMR